VGEIGYVYIGRIERRVVECLIVGTENDTRGEMSKGFLKTLRKDNSALVSSEFFPASAYFLSQP
jgi:hypothetical protein